MNSAVPGERIFVLVGGLPGSGKTTLARALSGELVSALLAKDDLKETLADALGAPATVERSRELGRAAALAVLRAARGCPGAVIDSTWYPYARPHVEALPGAVVELHCRVPPELARERYRARAPHRHAAHLDRERTDEELWGAPFVPLGVGPVLDVATDGPVDVAALAARVRHAAAAHGVSGGGPGTMGG